LARLRHADGSRQCADGKERQAAAKAALLPGSNIRGANPKDIPFYRYTQFALLINFKTAKALGLEMPAMLLARADEVIE
jgi:ABC-type uncharacterized transport system substrate-binding protein